MSQVRQDALSIFQAALAAADPYQAVLRHVRLEGTLLRAGRRRYDLRRYQRIFVLGGGKAGAPMARAIEEILGDRLTGGLLNVKYGHVAPLRCVELNECGHPVPDPPGESGARRIAGLAASATAGDLVIALISGGASALIPAPAAPVTLEAKQQTTRLLLQCGADIREINTIRKHLSTLKGGQLARLAQPATVLALLLSDVIGDDLETIGSGPAAPDPTTFADSLAALDKYGIRELVPETVRQRLEAGARGELPETPKPGDLNHVQNLIVGSNRLAVEAAAVAARDLGYRPLILTTRMEGEAREVARMQAAILREVLEAGRPVRPPACILSGGETTVTLRGHGKGGRNQEFALAAAIAMGSCHGAWAILSGGTDGTDGPTDAAGAVIDPETLTQARVKALDPAQFLTNNDSFCFFDQIDGLIRTGPTNTNVADVVVLLAAR